MINYLVREILFTWNLRNVFVFWIVAASLIWCLCLYFSLLRKLQSSNKLPSLRLRFYHVFGHCPLIFYHRIRAKIVDGLSLHIYDFQVINGYHQLFLREGISSAFVLFHMVTVFKADAVEVILSSNTEIKKSWYYDLLKPWLGTSMLISHDETWRVRRKLLTPALHFNILKDLLPIINKRSRALCEIFSNYTRQEFMDICLAITESSFDIICESVLGKEMITEVKSPDSYFKVVERMTSAIFDRIHSPWYKNDFIFKLSPSGRKFIKDVQIAHDFINQLISQKKTKLNAKIEDKPATDESELNVLGMRRKRMALIDLFLHEHLNNNTLSEADIREEVDTFAFAGHDTVSAAMSWVLYMIGLHPWAQDKVHEELDAIFDEDNRDATMDDLRKMKYLECVIKETLRLYPSVPNIARTTRNDINLGPYIIPKGCEYVVNAFLLHRDPDVFPNPEKFDPERFFPENCVGRHPFAYIPFAAGPRNCIGQRFAFMEMKTVLSSVLRRFKFRSLDARDRVHAMSHLILRPVNGLRLQVRKRDQSFDFHLVYYHK